jgi:hypothetical protein
MALRAPELERRRASAAGCGGTLLRRAGIGPNHQNQPLTCSRQSSRTFALVGVDRPTGSVATDQLLVMELNSHGVRFSAEQAISTGLTPVTYPRVAPNPLAPRWQTVFSKGNNQGARYQGTADVVLITGTTNGGPPGEYPSGKPPAPGNFRIVVGPSEN